MRPSIGPLAPALGGFLSLAVAMGIGRFVYTPILPHMAEALDLGPGGAGLIASANFAGYLLGALLAATPLPGGPRPWLLLGLALGALTTGLMAAVTVLPLFLLLRFSGGVASAFVLVFASTLVLERLARSGAARLAALHFAGVGFGIALSALLVALVDALGSGWRASWLAAALASLLLALPVPALVPAGDRAPMRAGAAAGPAPGLRRLAAAYGLFGFGYIVTATFLVAIVRADPAARAAEPFAWCLVGLAAAPSIWLWSRAGARIGAARAFALACLVEAVGVAASVLWPGIPGAVLAALLLGGTFMGVTALGLAEARRLAPANAARALAGMTAAFGVGQIVGPLVAGTLAGRTGGYTAPSLLAASALVLAAALARPKPALSGGGGLA
ncbi:MAG: YbfB/YjiJ family MFS transporter [Geminicoccaceae bacterium]|nr:YbfB/YjiJ family MFS transporter [Geminicoccaceae bacterium]